MQFDGRRLLADPESRDWQEAEAAGHGRMEAVVQAQGQLRSVALAGLLCLLLVIGAAILFPEYLEIPQVQFWMLAVAAAGLAGLAAGVVARRSVISPFRVLRWRLAGAVWGLLALMLWGAALGHELSMPWGDDVALRISAAGLAAAMLLASSAHWLPALLLTWLGLLVGQLLAGPVLTAMAGDLLVPVLGFDLVLLAMGMVLGQASRETARRTVTERLTRRELAQLKSRVSDQLDRLNAEADQRRDIEQALQEARGAADVAIRAKTEFLATMSHEIRTPLNGILPILEILRESRLDDDQRQFLETAYNSSRHLLRIINDVLDFAKAESGKLELESIEIDLRELVESVTDLMAKSAERRGLKLKYKIAEDVPRRVRGDSIRLRQVLTNLISNAIKFTENGEIRVEVKKRRASRKEVELVFTVRDTGVGMSRDTQRRLFRAFGQADASTTRKHGGTGLGLVICKRLVELMGGRIGVKSTLGEGSSFWFVLPMRKSASDVPPARKDLAGLRVLSLIEDPAEEVRLSEVLSDWRISEETVPNALGLMTRLGSGAQLGKSWGYELLLLGLRGSKQGLISLLQEIRKEPLLDDLRIIVFTPSEQLRNELQKEPGTFAMESPIDYRALQRQLNRLFDVEGQRIKSDEDTEALFDSLALDFDPKAVAAAVAHPVVRGAVVARVLVVEDNPVNLSVARRMLAKLGIDTVVARDGHEALAALEREQVDLVLMDCQMPAMDGYEATRRIRAEEEAADPPRHVPVIAMTANAMTGDRDLCLRAGMDDYLAKPLEFAALRRALEPWVRLRDGRHYSMGLTYAAGQPNGNTSPGPGNVAELAAGGEVEAADTPLDASKLADLQELMGDELPRLVRSFLDVAPQLVVDLEQAAAAGDLDAMVNPAHTLKSSSANVAALRLSGVAERLEEAARSGSDEAALKACKAVTEAFSAAAGALRSLLH